MTEREIRDALRSLIATLDAERQQLHRIGGSILAAAVSVSACTKDDPAPVDAGADIGVNTQSTDSHPTPVYAAVMTSAQPSATTTDAGVVPAEPEYAAPMPSETAPPRKTTTKVSPPLKTATKRKVPYPPTPYMAPFPFDDDMTA